MRPNLKTLCTRAALAGLLLGPSRAGTLVGYVRDQNWYARYQNNPAGVGYYEFAVNANARDSSAPGGAAATDVFGRFQMNGLPGGTYTVASWDVWWRSAFAFDVAVPASGTSAPVDLRLRATMWGYPAFWDEAGYSEFGQSFVASGPVTMIYLRDPLNGAFPRTVTVHAGGPDGPQVGVSRTYGNGGDQRLIYSHGQMPTRAGETYYLRVRTPGPARPTVLMQMDPRPDFSDPMPGGCLWLGNGGPPTPFPDRDLGVIIMADDDGLITDLFARPDGTVWNGVTSVGQTFVARGVNLISAAFWLSDPAAPTYTVRVRETGPAGAPVGPVKRGRPARLTADPEMLVVWAPGECPLTPGGTYYLEVTRDGGGTFSGVYANAGNPYAQGLAYRNGAPAPANVDLAGTIMEEADPGSATAPEIRFLGEPTVDESTRTEQAVTVRWETSVEADGVLEYAPEHPPYTLAVTNPEPTRVHEVRLSGLLPHTLYHFRVQSRREGHRPAVSRDLVICTRPAAPNLLVNPGFEEGPGSGPARPVSGWTAGGALDLKIADGGWFWGLAPHSGRWLLQGAVNGSASDGYIFQRVTGVQPGREYTFSAWVQTAMRENNTWKYDVWNDRGRLIHVRLGIDPAGGTDINRGSIRWTPRLYSHLHYSPVAVSAVAQGSALTVFVRMQGSGGQWHLYGVDDCALTHEPGPLQFQSPAWSNGIFQALLTGRPRRTNIVERSPDLRDWTPLSPLPNPGGQSWFTDTPPGPGPWFYRAREWP